MYNKDNIHGLQFHSNASSTLYGIDLHHRGGPKVTWHNGQSFTGYRIEKMIELLNSGDWVPVEKKEVINNTYSIY